MKSPVSTLLELLSGNILPNDENEPLKNTLLDRVLHGDCNNIFYVAIKTRHN